MYPGSSMLPQLSIVRYDSVVAAVRKAVFPAAGRGRREQLAEVRKISNMINFAYVRQGEPLGLGHAVLVTRELVGNEPFAVILADDVIDAHPPAIRQLIDAFARLDGPVIAVERVPRDEISNYGVIAIEPNARLGEGIYQ